MMHEAFKMLSSLAKGVLERALDEAQRVASEERVRGWSLQGFGMFRTYFPGDVRLNVWDSRYRVRGVSLVHDHPWNFKSIVLSGRLHNVRYMEHSLAPGDGALLERVRPAERLAHRFCALKPGPGGGLLGQVGAGRERSGEGGCVLVAQPTETYELGMTYHQRASEVHLSDPEDGTVTLNQRYGRKAVDEARVFWPEGTDWVSAEPRDATAGELVEALSYALGRWP